MTDAPNVPDAAARLAAKAERNAEAKTAWTEYLGEREALAARTEKLRALRLAAEEETAKAEKKAAKAKAKLPPVTAKAAKVKADADAKAPAKEKAPAKAKASAKAPAKAKKA